MLPHPLTWRLFLAEAMVEATMSTRISRLLFNVSEELPCQREDGNRADSFAVVMFRGEAIVGHVPSHQFALSI